MSVDWLPNAVMVFKCWWEPALLSSQKFTWLWLLHPLLFIAVRFCERENLRVFSVNIFGHLYNGLAES